jgi:hypothetical protein
VFSLQYHYKTCLNSSSSSSVSLNSLLMRLRKENLLPLLLLAPPPPMPSLEVDRCRCRTTCRCELRLLYVRRKERGGRNQESRIIGAITAHPYCTCIVNLVEIANCSRFRMASILFVTCLTTSSVATRYSGDLPPRNPPPPPLSSPSTLLLLLAAAQPASPPASP